MSPCVLSTISAMVSSPKRETVSAIVRRTGARGQASRSAGAMRMMRRGLGWLFWSSEHFRAVIGLRMCPRSVSCCEYI
ncbi:hypothetical protein BV22DRAFT_441728 [Leucogyrophana mollusca]|uniref:Uncharacterized protein n=2 Tax=Leucogyrophana mollusca TaxID=85980 RepID=A0ACB8BCH6_9AGAM|nr:hypothetical protein BV22DRAFT_588971 [Leucogyrophana mollusca]KAH7925417.1 hypothetical protein BV22DRAFT_441728 [Leucogyrophana mollusca]